MELHFTPTDQSNSSKAISLKRLVGKLLSEFQPFAVLQRSFILNDVPADFYVHTDKKTLTMAISSLLSSVVSRSRNGCIRVTAKRYNNIILFRLKDSNVSIPDAVDYNWQKLNVLAGKLGGCVIEDNVRKKTIGNYI